VTLSCTLEGYPKCEVKPISFKVDGSFHPEGTVLMTPAAGAFGHDCHSERQLGMVAERGERGQNAWFR
jgi:hypothetical protein